MFYIIVLVCYIIVSNRYYILVEEQMKQTQLLKGILEGCVLSVLLEEKTYGYELVQQLIQSGFTDLSAGTVYPLLQKLEKQGMIAGELLPSPDGPNRKYYSVTSDGQERLKEFEEQWLNLSQIVNHIIKKEQEK